MPTKKSLRRRKTDEKGSALHVENANGSEDQVAAMPRFTAKVIVMTLIVCMGGVVYGYDIGAISGIINIRRFVEQFGTPSANGPRLENLRKGLIVGMYNIGGLVGALSSSPFANRFGRKITLIGAGFLYMVGAVIQLATLTQSWGQIAVGRTVGGLAAGSLTVLVPMYIAESSPPHARGLLSSCFQLAITLGIFLGMVVDYLTYRQPGTSSWRIPIGVSMFWPLTLSLGMLLLPESPRFALSRGHTEEARHTLASYYGVPENHKVLQREIRNVQRVIDKEKTQPPVKLSELVTGPRMLYRVLLGSSLGFLQQTSGMNFFFWYGNTVFQATGVTNSFVVSMILSAVNFTATVPGIWLINRVGRRKLMLFGGSWMTICLLIFASLGSFSLSKQHPTLTPVSGACMIVFACLTIAGFAVSYGPLLWTLIAELYPSRLRAQAQGVATALNWLSSFLIGLVTPFATAAIDFKYGFVFAIFTGASVFIVYFFLCETFGRSLEEIQEMYVAKVSPRSSAKWEPDED